MNKCYKSRTHVDLKYDKHLRSLNENTICATNKGYLSQCKCVKLNLVIGGSRSGRNTLKIKRKPYSISHNEISNIHSFNFHRRIKFGTASKSNYSDRWKIYLHRKEELWGLPQAVALFMVFNREQMLLTDIGCWFL